jgi:hypothetical protein
MGRLGVGGAGGGRERERWGRVQFKSMTAPTLLGSISLPSKSDSYEVRFTNG